MFAILIVVATLLVAAACEAPSQPTFVSPAEPRADLAPAQFSGRALDYATGAGVPNVPVEIGTQVGRSTRRSSSSHTPTTTVRARLPDAACSAPNASTGSWEGAARARPASCRTRRSNDHGRLKRPPGQA
jgi:hypothetical protein